MSGESTRVEPSKITFLASKTTILLPNTILLNRRFPAPNRRMSGKPAKVPQNVRQIILNKQTPRPWASKFSLHVTRVAFFPEKIPPEICTPQTTVSSTWDFGGVPVKPEPRLGFKGSKICGGLGITAGLTATHKRKCKTRAVRSRDV